MDASSVPQVVAATTKSASAGRRPWRILLGDVLGEQGVGPVRAGDTRDERHPHRGGPAGRTRSRAARPARR
jgi:hypothetical protein